MSEGVLHFLVVMVLGFTVIGAVGSLLVLFGPPAYWTLLGLTLAAIIATASPSLNGGIDVHGSSHFGADWFRPRHPRGLADGCRASDAKVRDGTCS